MSGPPRTRVRTASSSDAPSPTEEKSPEAALIDTHVAAPGLTGASGPEEDAVEAKSPEATADDTSGVTETGGAEDSIVAAKPKKRRPRPAAGMKPSDLNKPVAVLAEERRQAYIKGVKAERKADAAAEKAAEAEAEREFQLTLVGLSPEEAKARTRLHAKAVKEEKRRKKQQALLDKELNHINALKGVPKPPRLERAPPRALGEATWGDTSCAGSGSICSICSGSLGGRGGGGGEGGGCGSGGCGEFPWPSREERALKLLALRLEAGFDVDDETLGAIPEATSTPKPIASSLDGIVSDDLPPAWELPANLHVRVVCRVRPTNQIERDKGGTDAVHFLGPTEVEVEAAPDMQQEVVDAPEPNSSLRRGSVVNTGDKHMVTHRFTFDRVLGSQSTQAETYEIVALPVVADFMKGFNATIFAYGQTGSGKTYTMEGSSVLDPEAKGIIPRAATAIFDCFDPGPVPGTLVAKVDGAAVTVQVSYVEIYLERIRDLLDQSGKKENLAVREDPRRGVFIDGAAVSAVCSEGRLLDVLGSGAKARAKAATAMNAGSSRSHSVFMVTVSAVNAHGSRRSSKLFLVDLAGSEMVRKTQATGRQLEEAQAINKSLSALGSVIAALADDSGKEMHVPCRDSKLTRCCRTRWAQRYDVAAHQLLAFELQRQRDAVHAVLWQPRQVHQEQAARQPGQDARQAVGDAGQVSRRP